MVRPVMQAPETTAPHPLIRLLPGRDRRVKAGHPWAFSNEIAMNPEARALPPGAPVRLEGDDGVRHGTWLFNPHSLIAARRLDRDPAAAVDAAWLRARLGTALALREQLFATPFYRLVHAEADGLPGLVIDRYGDALALQANTAGMEALTPLIVEALEGLLAPRLIVARNDAAVRTLEGLAEETGVLLGEAGPVLAEEGGLRFGVDLLGGQKTGWFFDQRENRDRVAKPGRRRHHAGCLLPHRRLRPARRRGRGGPGDAARPQRPCAGTGLRDRQGERPGRARHRPPGGGDGGAGALGNAGVPLRRGGRRPAGLRQAAQGPAGRAAGLCQAGAHGGNPGGAGRVPVHRLLQPPCRTGRIRRSR